MSAASDGRVFCFYNALSEKKEQLIDFGMRDARGRAIGYRIVRWTMEQLERDEERPQYSLVCKPEDLGRWCVASTSATRGGIRFGASTSDLWARTEQELEELIAARVAGARARYARKGGAL